MRISDWSSYVCSSDLFLLPRGLWDVAGERVTPAAIKHSALLTIEGELDDISGLGQTQAAHDLCSSIPARRRENKVVEGAGHYGIFSGDRKSGVVGQSVSGRVELGGCRNIKKKQ